MKPFGVGYRKNRKIAIYKISYLIATTIIIVAIKIVCEISFEMI